MVRGLTFAAIALFVQAGQAVAGEVPATTFYWTAPLIIFAAFLIGWGAEAAQYMVSQGLALALLAWLQTLPEFAVEAELAFRAGADPTHAADHFVTANFTGSIRLLMGFGMPIVYFIHFFTTKGPARKQITLDPLHSVEVVSLFPAVLYFFFIYYRGVLDLVDTAVLLLFYGLYLGLLLKMPPEEEGESMEELPFVARRILKGSRFMRVAGVTAIFVLGGVILYSCVHPFVESLKTVAVAVGIPAYFVLQWVAPLLSEFPEKVTAFNWARQENKSKLGLMNFCSSNINQMTMLVAMIPLMYCLGAGQFRTFHFDHGQKEEILLTACQAALCMVLLFNMKFEWWDACGMFVLWIVQAAVPSLREHLIWPYLAWIVLEIMLAMLGIRKWSFPLRLRSRDLRRPPRRRDSAES